MRKNIFIFNIISIVTFTCFVRMIVESGVIISVDSNIPGGNSKR